VPLLRVSSLCYTHKDMQSVCQLVEALSTESRDRIPVLRFPELEQQGVVAHAILSRIGGVSEPPCHWLNVSLNVGDDAEAVHRNRMLAKAAAGMPPDQFVNCQQVGGNSVAIVDSLQHDGHIRADALVTSERGLFLSMSFADCLPIILCDAAVPAVALVHAGWRGSLGLVALHAWRALSALGARPERTRAFFGPAIGPCCYEVGEDVAHRVLRLGQHGEQSLLHRAGKMYLDLATLNEALLNSVGIGVIRSDICTACHLDLFFSHRAEKGRTGRFAIYAGIA